MKKEITNIFINSAVAVANKNATFDATKIYSININTPPIVIKNKANLKVANICHTGTGHADNIILFKIDGMQTDYSKYLGNDGSTPTILSTTFNNTRNLYEENDIPLLKQTINEIKISLSTLNASGVNSFTGFFSITTAGTGYLTGQILTFTGGNGQDINASITASSGAITNITALNVGTLYNATPTLSTSINGSGAILTVSSLSGSAINTTNGITITNAGVGYKVGQSLTFSGSGAGTGANITIATVSATGAILTFTYTSGGTNFTLATGTNIIVSVSSTTITQTAVITPLMNYGNVTDGIANTLNFCMSLKIEEEVNE